MQAVLAETRVGPWEAGVAQRAVESLEALASMVESAVVWRAMVMVVAMLVAVAGMVAEAAIWAVGADAWVEVLD